MPSVETILAQYDHLPAASVVTPEGWDTLHDITEFNQPYYRIDGFFTPQFEQAVIESSRKDENGGTSTRRHPSFQDITALFLQLSGLTKDGTGSVIGHLDYNAESPELHIDVFSGHTFLGNFTPPEGSYYEFYTNPSSGNYVYEDIGEGELYHLAIDPNQPTIVPILSRQLTIIHGSFCEATPVEETASSKHMLTSVPHAVHIPSPPLPASPRRLLNVYTQGK